MAVTTIYQARKVVTMNPSRPVATHVAVRDGRILGVGTLDELTGWGDYRLDRVFAEKVLFPGLVEGHSHVAEGVMWRFVYCGFFDRTDPDGKQWSGVKSIEQVIARLASENAERLEMVGSFRPNLRRLRSVMISTLPLDTSSNAGGPPPSTGGYEIQKGIF
jgi:predicted amidohydrolase YtcJ